MTQKIPGKPLDSGKAEHGASSEVTWQGGAGRQPYANQPPREADEPNASSGEVAEGDRGEMSGRNLDQLERSKRNKP